MVLRKIMGLFVCALVIGSAAMATANIPDPTETTAGYATYQGNDDLVLFNLPSGIGSAFTEAQIMNNGAEVDASISMVVRDAFASTIANFPAEDMWLESDGGGMVPCDGGTAADLNTNDDGETQWVQPLNAGGYSMDVCRVYVNGLPLNGAPFTLFFNSADINGDGTVNILDVSQFSSAYFGDYAFSADFFADGVLNVLDVGRLASGLGGSCP